MSKIFAPIYEVFFYDPHYRLLFKQLFDGNGYGLLGMSLLLVPLVLFILYYWDSRLPWKNPYRRSWSWYLWLFIVAAATAGISYAIVYPEFFNSNNPALINAMTDPSTGYSDFAERLVVLISVLNGVYSLIVGFLWSLLLKQKSVLHIHIPF